MSLLEFLKNNPTMFQNYQAIVIKTLLENDSEFSATINEIKNKIAELNFDREDFEINNAWSTVKKVLDDHNVISINGENVKLNNENISDVEKTECLKICGQKIVEFHFKKIVKGDYNLWRMPPGSAKENYPYELEFLKSNTIGVGWGKIGDDVVNENMTKNQTEELFHKLYRPIDGKSNSPQAFTNFTHEIKPKDIIVLIKKKTILDFAIVVSPYYYQKNPSIDLPDNTKSYSHRRNVVWLNRGSIPESEAFEFSRLSACDRVKDKQLKEQYLAILRGKKLAKYFLLRHNSKGPWKDDSGKKYHLGRDSDGRMGKRVGSILDAGIGTKTIWYSTSKDEFYFWGYGTVTGIEEIKKDSEWYLTYDDFKFFEGDTNIQGRELTRATTSVNQQLQDLQNDKEWKFNWQLAINPISKKLYQEIIGEDLTSEDDEIDSMNQGNFDPKLEKLYEILKRKKQIIFYGPPGTGKTYSANKLKKYILSKNTPQPISSNSKNWIYSVDPENWEIVKTHHIWASSVPIEKIRERINQNDNVIFFVTGTKKFQGIFKFSSDWYTAKSVVWPDETNEVRYLSQIKLEPILLGDLNLWDIAKNLEYFPDPENKRDSSLKLQGRGGYPSNKESLSRKDFETICSHMRSIGSSTNDQNFSKNVTFHQSYSYEDFVEGIRPDITSSDKVIYKPQDGIFKEICESARKDPQNNYVLTIDEINRGNVSKIFGELITLIESDKRKEEHKVTLPYTRQSFWIPKNLFIIGTMNTADRSIAQLDTALRRRFAFEELMPEYTLKDLAKSIDGISLKDLLSTLNSSIRAEGPQFRDKQIGHSYFMDDCKNIEDLRTIFAVEIIPLLQDYFYHDYKKLEEKILNSDFIDSSKDEIKPDWKTNDEIFKAAINKILASN